MKETIIETRTQEDRIKDFQKGYQKLMDDNGIAFRPQITPDGPMNLLVDLKMKDEKPKTEDKA